MQELMKKRIYLLFLLLIYSWTFIGCHNEQKEEKLNDGLICYTETGKDGESLKGVKRLADGKILVEPAPYESVTADSCFIIARKSRRDTHRAFRYLYRIRGKVLYGYQVQDHLLLFPPVRCIGLFGAGQAGSACGRSEDRGRLGSTFV